MNIETMEVYRDAELQAAILRGEPIVPISEATAKMQEKANELSMEEIRANVTALDEIRKGLALPRRISEKRANAPAILEGDGRTG